MPKPEQSKESARTGKAGEVLPGRGNVPNGGAVNGERGSQAHGEDGSQVDLLTANGVAHLLKGDLQDAVEGLDTDEAQTTSEDGTQQTKGRKIQEPKDAGRATDTGETETETEAETETEGESTEKSKAGATRTAPNAEALKEVEAWQAHVAELEEQLEGAEADSEEAKALEQQIQDANKELKDWEALAKGEPAEAGTPNAEVPEALQQAISEWEQSGGGELPPALQSLVEKRIHKLTSDRETQKTRADQAEAKLAELETENLQLKASGASRASGPLLDPARLDQLAQAGEQAIEEIDAVLDGSATEEEAKRVAGMMGSERLDPGDPGVQRALKKQKRQLERNLAAIPAEKQRIQAFRAEEAKVAPIAKQVFPFLFDKASPEYQVAQEMLATVPDLAQRTPNHQMALGFLVLGRREAMRQHPELFGGEKPKPAKAGTPNLPRRAPRKAPTSGGGSAAPNGAKTKAREAEEISARQRFEKKPTSESVRELLKVSLRA